MAAFGAKGDGVTNDSPAFSAAIAFANSLNPESTGAAGVVGVTIAVPDGRYVLHDPIQPILRPGVSIVGSSDNGAVLLVTADGAVFTWGDRENFPIGGGLSHLKVEYPSRPGTTACIVNVAHASRLRFDDLLIVNARAICSLGTAADEMASAIHVTNVRGYVNNAGGSAFTLLYGAGLFLSAVQLFVGGVEAPQIDRLSSMTTTPGTNAIQAGTAGTWDTVQVTGCFFERFFIGVQLLARPGVILSNLFIANTYFDYIRDSVISLNSESEALGGVFNVVVGNSWLSSWEGSAVESRGPGQVRGVQVQNCYIASAGKHGIVAEAGTSELLLSNTRIDGANRFDIGAAAIKLDKCDRSIVSGCVAGHDSAWSGFGWQAESGLRVTADTDRYTVTGNDFAGASSAVVLEENTSGSSLRVFLHNRESARTAGVEVPFPDSGERILNTTPRELEVHVHGGSVTEIVKNDVTIEGMKSGSIRLAPGDSFTLTYATAPTLTTFVLG